MATYSSIIRFSEMSEGAQNVLSYLKYLRYDAEIIYAFRVAFMTTRIVEELVASLQFDALFQKDGQVHWCLTRTFPTIRWLTFESIVTLRFDDLFYEVMRLDQAHVYSPLIDPTFDVKNNEIRCKTLQFQMFRQYGLFMRCNGVKQLDVLTLLKMAYIARIEFEEGFNMFYKFNRDKYILMKRLLGPATEGSCGLFYGPDENTDKRGRIMELRAKHLLRQMSSSSIHKYYRWLENAGFKNIKRVPDKQRIAAAIFKMKAPGLVCRHTLFKDIFEAIDRQIKLESRHGLYYSLS